ncbi:DUF423 domain-containing protein [Sinorhizobium sp. BG8]|uniref:DUF423 domain-containing protein n=1 Tax=Sinorhizobium sp. BG8 TaxID=2613773 RepID=UPI00193E6A27|nr:DUF423 domain-containing protein [Sinorhizobium sp. BG8]QRM56465.1 DUF423 domain-containing protein [Sinorhizobium sp. BG8]
MTLSPGRSLTLFSAGLMGIAGVVSAAAASHVGGDPRLLAGVSAMCLAHAPALIALYAAWPSLRTAPISVLLIAAGTALFAGDLTMRHFTGEGLFPMSAPTGGFMMMAGWLAVSAGALFGERKG